MALPGYKEPKEEKEEKSKKLSPFDIINHINSKGGYTLKEENEYNAYIINKFFSFFSDTVGHAAEMTLHWELDAKLQYDYYYHSLSRGKRYTKWIKAEQEEDIKLIMEHYKVNAKRAEEMKRFTQMLGHDIIEEIRTLYGGK